jgi:hypothetical protein
VETAMLKLLYKPVAIVAGIIGGLLSGLIFKNLWKVVGRGSDPPAPLDSERAWGEVLLASVLHGAVYALVKTAVDRGAAEWTRKKTGSGQAARSSIPASHPTITRLKPTPVPPDDHGPGRSQLR